MICNSCKNKGIYQALKQVICIYCNKKVLINSISYKNICKTCSDKLQICQLCGKIIKEENKCT